MEPDTIARRTYRATFGEFARRLDELQRIKDSGAADIGRIECAVERLEEARRAYNDARDTVARELGVFPAPRVTVASQARYSVALPDFAQRCK
jgi:DNA-binding SARP family transcriptional activator